MVKHIILMHGRAIKPAKAALEALARRAIPEGLRRAGHPAHAAAFESGAIKFSSAYFGDINNAILAAKKRSIRKKLTDTDPDCNNAPCFPASYLEQAYDLTQARPHFTRNEYHKVLAEAQDWRFLDEAADLASLFGALFSAGLLNRTLIKAATADLYAYLTEHAIGSTVRQRLNQHLQPAIEAGHDICLLTHSMGCMVAYDVMWKYAHMTEYAHLRARAFPVSLWVTFGNPIGETGVASNLMDGRYTNPADKFPRKQVKQWRNVYAEDDYIAHVEKIGPIYRHLTPGDLHEISDKKIHNCWTYADSKTGKLTSNPHDLYGYLMHDGLAGYVGDWLST